MEFNKEVTDEELKTIQKTKKIWLAIHACPVPPVALFTEQPNFLEITIAPEAMEQLKKKKD